jgi:hypothetical protein
MNSTIHKRKTVIVCPLVNKFPVFSGTRRFITAFTSALHLSSHCLCHSFHNLQLTLRYCCRLKSSGLWPCAVLSSSSQRFERSWCRCLQGSGSEGRIFLDCTLDPWTRTVVYQNYRPRVVRIARLLTPWSRILLEKLSGLQLVKKFPAYYGTRRFITAFTSARHLSLSWASPIQSIPSHPTSWRSISTCS